MPRSAAISAEDLGETAGPEPTEFVDKAAS
jgi:hypothetical protein